MKCIGILMDIANEIRTLAKDGEYKKLVLKLLRWLFIVISIVGMIWLSFFGLVKLIGFIRSNFTVIVIGASIILGLAAYARNRSGVTAPQTTIVNEDIEREAANRTYKSISIIILEILQKMSKVFCLIYPNHENDIFSPVRVTKQGNIWHYQFVAVKSGEVDVRAAERFASAELERMLFDGNTYGLPQNTKFIDGLERPILTVDSVKDCDTHILLDVVVTTEKYVKRSDSLRRMQLDRHNGKNNADDDEFI